MSSQKQGAIFHEYVIDQPGFGPKINNFFPNRGSFEIVCEVCHREWCWHYYSSHEDHATLKISRSPSSKKPKPKPNTFSDADREREAKRTGRRVGNFDDSPHPRKVPKPKPKSKPESNEAAPEKAKETRDSEALSGELRNYVPELFGLKEELGDWGNTSELSWKSEGDLAKAFEQESLGESECLYLIAPKSLKGAKWKHEWPDTVERHELKTKLGTSLHVYTLAKNELAISLFQKALQHFGATIVAPKKFRVFTMPHPGTVTISKPF